jgi:hypothetical protein
MPYLADETDMQQNKVQLLSLMSRELCFMAEHAIKDGQSALEDT